MIKTYIVSDDWFCKSGMREDKEDEKRRYYKAAICALA